MRTESCQICGESDFQSTELLEVFKMVSDIWMSTTINRNPSQPHCHERESYSTHLVSGQDHSFINRDTETTQERGSAVLRLAHSSLERADFTDVTHILPLTFEKQGFCALNQDHKTKSQAGFKGMERRDPSMLQAGDHRLKPAYTRADRFSGYQV